MVNLFLLVNGLYSNTTYKYYYNLPYYINKRYSFTCLCLPICGTVCTTIFCSIELHHSWDRAMFPKSHSFCTHGVFFCQNGNKYGYFITIVRFKIVNLGGLASIYSDWIARSSPPKRATVLPSRMTEH